MCDLYQNIGNIHHLFSDVTDLDIYLPAYRNIAFYIIISNLCNIQTFVYITTNRISSMKFVTTHFWVYKL